MSSANKAFRIGEVAANIVLHLTGKDAVSAICITRVLWTDNYLWLRHIEFLLRLPQNTYSLTMDSPIPARVIYRLLCQQIDGIYERQTPTSQVYLLDEPDSCDSVLSDIHVIDLNGPRLLYESKDFQPVSMLKNDRLCMGRENGLMVTRDIENWSLVGCLEDENDNRAKPHREWLSHGLHLIRLHREGDRKGTIGLHTVDGKSLASFSHPLVDGAKSLAGGQLLTYSNSAIKIWDIDNRCCLKTFEHENIREVEESGGFIAFVCGQGDIICQTINGEPAPKVLIWQFATKKEWFTFSDGAHVSYEDKTLAVLMPNGPDPKPNIINFPEEILTMKLYLDRFIALVTSTQLICLSKTGSKLVEKTLATKGVSDVELYEDFLGRLIIFYRREGYSNSFDRLEILDWGVETGAYPIDNRR